MIRLAQSSDDASIHQLLVDNIAGTQSTDTQWISDRLTSACSLIVVDDECGTIVGAIVGQVVEDEAEIHDVAITTKFRKQGRAAKLVLEFERRAAEMGSTQVFLEVRASNDPAKRLYQKVGYRSEHTRRHYYSDGEDALIFNKDIQHTT